MTRLERFSSNTLELARIARRATRRVFLCLVGLFFLVLTLQMTMATCFADYYVTCKAEFTVAQPNPFNPLEVYFEDVSTPTKRL